MDGSNREVLVVNNIRWPNGLTLDYEEGNVYWVDAHYHFISRMNTDSTNRYERLIYHKICFSRSKTAG